jgi:hypothetical protein
MEAAHECPVCRAVLYCCKAHAAEDAGAHAAVCRLLAFSGDLSECAIDEKGGLTGRGLHSFTFQLNLSSV